MPLSLLADAAATPATIWLPEGASTFAADHDWLFLFITWLCVISFAAIIGAMVYFMVKYKRKQEGEPTADIHGSTTIEVAWSVIPSFFLVALFYFGLMGWMNAAVPPANSLNIHVTGQQWSWSFTYPNGGSDSTLVVPVGQPVKLTMSSVDVIHSFFVPAFRVKRDVVPGRYTTIWFQSDAPGEYDVLCTEYCGTNHSLMLSKVKVVSDEEYKKYTQGLMGCQEGQSLADCGAVTFKRNGCNACHTVDGSKLVGPSLKGVFGQPVKLTDGSTVTVDESYVRESVMNPTAKVVEGFNPAMPTFAGRLNEEQMNSLVEYIRSLAN